MTVLTNGQPVVTPRGSVLSAFLPKPRATAPRGQAAPRRSLRERFAGHGKQVKDFLVAASAASCADVAAFHFHPWAGWLAVGLSLLFVDKAVDRDEVMPDERDR